MGLCLALPQASGIFLGDVRLSVNYSFCRALCVYEDGFRQTFFRISTCPSAVSSPNRTQDLLHHTFALPLNCRPLPLPNYASEQQSQQTSTVNTEIYPSRAVLASHLVLKIA